MIFTKDLPVDEKYPESCVYWIYHKGKHTDLKVSGYVGVCVNGAEHRFKRHVYDALNGSDYIVHKAIRKYGEDISLKVLLTSDPELCLLMEEMLRPSSQMGGEIWNIGSGGVSSQVGCKQTPERIKKRADKLRGMKRTNEFCERMSRLSKGKPKSPMAAEKSKITRTGVKRSASAVNNAAQALRLVNSLKGAWEQVRSNASVWSKAIHAERYIEDFPSHKTARLAKFLGEDRNSVTTMFIKISGGWQPSTDTDYLQWLSEYKQKETLYVP